MFYLGLIIASAAAVAVLSYQYFDESRRPARGTLSSAGSGDSGLRGLGDEHPFCIVSSRPGDPEHFPVRHGCVFHGREQALEAGIKYLILASASAAFLLFGMALIYADTGTMEFSSLRNFSDRSSLALLLPGIALTVTGIGFKLGVVPFHCG